MPIPSPVPNTVQREVILAAIEATRGTAEPPDHKWYGAADVTKTTPTADRDEYTGGYDQNTPVYGPPDVSGTYAVALAYQDIPILMRVGIKDGVTGVSDAQPTPGYTYTFTPTFADDDIGSATVWTGFPGIPWRSTGVMFDEFTIRGSIDDAAAAWMLDARLRVRDKVLQLAVAELAVTSAAASTLTATGAGWTVDEHAGEFVHVVSGPGQHEVAEILSNTIDTLTIVGTWNTTPTSASTFIISEPLPAVSDRDRDTIDFEGTRLYIDDDTSTLGTRRSQGRFKSFSVTYQNNIGNKRTADDVGSFSAKIDRGTRDISAQIVMEYDYAGEDVRWIEKANRLVRIEQPNGPIIQVSPETRMLARIDLPKLRWTEARRGVAANNVLVTYQGRAYRDTTLGYPIAVVAKTDQATLP